MNEFLKELFGENEKLDFAELDKKLQEKGIKLVDLGKGEYVSKKKYDDDTNSLNTKFTDLETKYNDVVNKQNKDKTEEEKKQEEFMKQFEAIKNASEQAAKELDLYKKREAMRNNGIDNQRFMDLALFELRESKDFEADIKKWAEDNKSLIAPEGDKDKDKDKGNLFRVNAPMNGNPNNNSVDESDFIKGVLKGAGLKAEDIK